MRKVFVSHIDEEAPIAAVIKKWMEPAFLGLFDVFVSSVPGDISAGRVWFQSLEDELSECGAMLVICSPVSVNRLWINFEAGAGWIRGIPVIPICHSGMTKGELPMPLCFFQALSAEDDDFVSQLISELAECFESRKPLVSQEMLKDFEQVSLIRTVLGAESTEEELGFLDHLVSVMEGMEQQTKLMHQLNEDINAISIETESFGDEVARSTQVQTEATPRHLQRLARNYAQKIDEFASKLKVLNTYYEESVPKMDESFQYVVTFQNTRSAEDEPSFDEFVGVLETVEGQIEGLRSAMVFCRDELEQQDNFERHMRQATRNTIQQIDSLVLNLDRTREMFHRGRVALVFSIGD